MYFLSSTASTAFRRFSWTLLFLNVSILLEGKSCHWLWLNLSFLVLIKVSSNSEGIKFQQFKKSKKVILKRVTILKVAILYTNNCTFISPLYTFPWRGTKLFTRQIKVQLGKSTLNIVFIKGKDADSGGKLTPFRPFLPSRTASFPYFDRKNYGPIRRKWTSMWLIPRRHNK